MDTIPNPGKIVKFLNKYVVGQEEAKKALAYTAFIHEIKKVSQDKSDRKDPYNKTTILLTGPTGVGKTYLVKTLGKCVGRDIHTVNAKDLVTEGYKGMSFSDFIGNILSAYGKGAAKKLEESIIFIDEFDKICINKDDTNGFDTPLQQQLLKVVEGNEVKGVDTGKILFILGGNFQSLRDARKPKNPLGFAPQVEDTSNTTLHEELSKAGVIKELAGRISLVAELLDLKLEDMINIVKAKDNVTAQYKEIFKNAGIKSILTPKKCKEIAENCIKNKTGARGIQTELDKFLIDSVMEFKGNIKTKEVVKEVVKETKAKSPKKEPPKKEPPLPSILDAFMGAIEEYADDEGIEISFTPDAGLVDSLSDFHQSANYEHNFTVNSVWRCYNGALARILEVDEVNEHVFGAIEDDGRTINLVFDFNGVCPSSSEFSLTHRIQ